MITVHLICEESRNIRFVDTVMKMCVDMSAGIAQCNVGYQMRTICGVLQSV